MITWKSMSPSFDTASPRTLHALPQIDNSPSLFFSFLSVHIPVLYLLKFQSFLNMAQTSPSEFLTFYRTIRSSSRHVPAASRCLARRPISRPFTVSMQRSVDDYNELGPKKTHTVDKAAKGDQNVQSNESRKGAQ